MSELQEGSNDTTVASLGNMGLPHFNVEVKIKYNINFSERYNIDGNNEPVPHTEL